MQIIGHQEQCERLLKLNNIPHAMLFTGPEAIGKKRIARWYAKKLLGSLQHPDLHLIEKDPEKRDIPAAELRELIHKLQLKSYAGGKKIAIIDDKSSINFEDLQAHAKCVASYLQSKNISRNLPIGVFLPKSIEAIKSFLGVLYNGDFYVPLDVKNPFSRIEAIIKNIDINFLLFSNKNYTENIH